MVKSKKAQLVAVKTRVKRTGGNSQATTTQETSTASSSATDTTQTQTQTPPASDSGAKSA
jgi:hypothetical protein